MADNTPPDVPVPATGLVSWADLDDKTWVQLRECTYIAERALRGLAPESPVAAAALEALTAILAQDWKGPDQQPDE